MKKTNTTNRNTTTTAITFTQAKTVVTADRYVPYALYTQNKTIVEALGGEIVKGVGGFQAKFAKVADAKAFVAQAITHMSEKEYNATRKTAKGKGNSKPTSASKKRVPAVEYVTLTDSDGLTYQVPKSALASVSTNARMKATTKGKGKTETKPTPANTKKTTKRTRAKGNGIDFDAIKGKTPSDKNKALHAMLVRMGMKDSRSKEYQEVWSARPWAK